MRLQEKKLVLSLVNALLDNAYKQKRCGLYKRALRDVSSSIDDESIQSVVKRDRAVTRGQLIARIDKHFEKRKKK